MRNTCGSSKTSQTMRPSSRALARSCPIGFSSTIRASPPRPRLADPPHDRREGRRRRAAIEQPPALGAELGVERREPLAQRAEGGRVVERRGDVGEPSRERLPAPLVQPVAGELLDRPAGALAEVLVVEAASARADDRVTLRQQALVGQVVERRKQLAARQIARRAEDDHDQRSDPPRARPPEHRSRAGRPNVPRRREQASASLQSEHDNDHRSSCALRRSHSDEAPHR